ncbi:MAG: hypothetical protein QXR84_00630 [Candidatus Bathyarchaeia archaeon]
MSETKYGKYILKEPLEKIRGYPSLHACGHEECFVKFPGFPADFQLIYITEPFTMVDRPHWHEVDELLFIWGSNPANFFDFDAEIEVYLGEEQEKHIINYTSIIYVPKRLPHGPIIIKRVNKPFLWGHILFSPVYTGVGHQVPSHKERQPYTPEEAKRLRGR